MEDFQAAYKERHADVEALHAARRRTAAMHFGGVAVECLLKAIAWVSLPKNSQGEREWKTKTNDPGHTISRPSHNLEEILHISHKLRDRAKGDPRVYIWLNNVERPECHFIDMRYLGRETNTSDSEQRYKRWRKSYTSLVSWLEQQGTQF
jgi:hypothetical protein